MADGAERGLKAFDDTLAVHSAAAQNVATLLQQLAGEAAGSEPSPLDAALRQLSADGSPLGPRAVRSTSERLQALSSVAHGIGGMARGIVEDVGKRAAAEKDVEHYVRVT
jgi:hypothetical protein